MIMRLLSLAVLLVVSGITAGYADVLVFADGKSSARIVAPSDPPPIVKTALNDLALYLNKATGAEFANSSGPNVIQVLDTVPADAPPELKTSREGYWISAKGDTVRIVGASPVGAAYGIYGFLERYVGVRWFLPADDGDYVPALKSLSIPEASVFSEPAFRMRWIGKGLWALRNGSNTQGIGGIVSSDGREVDAGFQLRPRIYHTQGEYLPTEQWFATHPEYFSNTESTPDKLTKYTKLCTTRPEVIRLLAKNMGRYLDEHPETEVISLSPSDGNRYCECAKCNALDEPGTEFGQSKTRRMMIFYTAVINELRKSHPGIKAAVGAYAAYATPPKDREIRLPADVYVVLCHWGPGCLAHPVDDPNCPGNTQYKADIAEWLRRSSDVLFYEYYWKNDWLGLPWPIVHSIERDIPYFRKIGVKGLYTQFSDENAYSNGLNYYVAAKLMWNPEADASKLVDEYCEKYFAESAKPVRAYYDLLERRMASMKEDVAGNAAKNAGRVFDAKTLKTASAKLDEAMKQAATDTTRKRVGRLQTHLRYSAALVRALTLRESSDKNKALRILKSLRKQTIDKPEDYAGILAAGDLAYIDRLIAAAAAAK